MFKPGDIVRTTTRVNLRKAPSLTAPILRTLAPGLEFRINQGETIEGLPWWAMGPAWVAAVAPDGTILLEDATPLAPLDRALAFTLRWEGKFSEDQNDPGNWTGGRVGVGAFKGTKFGISAAAYPDLDIANLTLQDAGRIYDRDYWELSGADALQWPLSLAHFDTAVNMGVGRAGSLLSMASGSAALYVALRLRLYATFADFARYGPAWVNRCTELLEVIAHDVSMLR